MTVTIIIVVDCHCAVSDVTDDIRYVRNIMPTIAFIYCRASFQYRLEIKSDIFQLFCYHATHYVSRSHSYHSQTVPGQKFWLSNLNGIFEK